MKTEPVMDSTDYSGAELRSSLIKSEDIEESIERKNGYGMSREEKPILSYKKEEDEEGGERQGEEVKREDGVKDEEVERNDWNPEIEGDEQREGDVMDETPQTDRKSDLKQEEESLPSLVTSCLLEQSRVPSHGSPVISSRAENTGLSEVFACSQCPFTHMEEVKLHQHIEKVHPEEHSRIQSNSALCDCPLHSFLAVEDWWIPYCSLKKTSDRNLCFTVRASRSASAGEDMKTEPVMDSTDYSGAELRSSLIKSEDIEESIERKNGYGMSREEKPILSNIKEEEEEGGERQGEEVKREDGVKDEEVERNDWNPEIEGDEQREGDVMDQTPKTDRKSYLKQEGESLPSLVTSCLLEQSRVPSPGSPVISSRAENTGEDMKTEPVMDSTDYSGAELRSSLIKSEDIEESIERKNGYGMSRQEELILSNIKEEEEEEGGERQDEEVKREDGVKDEEVERNDWNPEIEGDEQREGNVMDQTPKIDRISDLKQEEESLPSLVTSCLLEQSSVPSPGSPVISSRAGNTGQSEMFSCSQCGKSFKSPSYLKSSLTTSNQNLCFTLRASSPASSGEDMKTEPVMDSTDYSGVELRSSLIKSEDIEESIERKNGYGMSREEELILSNIKEEEEEGGERQGEEVKREDGVKEEEVERNDWNPEIEGDEQREGDVMDQTPKTDRKSDLKQEEESLPSLVTSCLLEQSRVPSPGSPVISSREENAGQSEVFACSQCGKSFKSPSYLKVMRCSNTKTASRIPTAKVGLLSIDIRIINNQEADAYSKLLTP
ncbi:hypothetical protein SKAU_G00076740 [Synaphobranchus kaupii]|uniref:C2H2-type domain-containing protein n=1 Tax=Synaphobranchus kaupii TaxID=118154 RepID=A0A9Q1G8Z5_SYNKA|nr:hypothetical protein SKAU_G00076740 [Synaphobranchus kaupii]